MPRRPVPPLGQDEFRLFAADEIEDSQKINQDQLNDEEKPSKIVVKSTNEDFHPCELIAATYVFEPVGD